METELRISTKCRFLISGDSPMPRRQRATQQRSLVAMAAWGRRRLHPDEALESLNTGAGLLVPLGSTRWGVTSLCPYSGDLLPQANISCV